MSARELWFKMYPTSYLRATRSMSLEQRGAYMDHICMQMERDTPLPDDASWLAHQMHISVRKARAIVDELIALKKVKRTSEGLSNDKCEQVIAERKHQADVNAEIARKREAARRDAVNSSPSVKPQFADVSWSTHQHFTAEPELSGPRTEVENSKKQNKINGAAKVSCLEDSTTRARGDRDIEVEGSKGVADATAFDRFWSSFPQGRKRDKVGAREAFEKIVSGRHKNGQRAGADEIIAAVAAGRGIDPREPPMPTTWLNGARWLDDLPAGAAAAAMPPPAPWWSKPDQRNAMTTERWRSGIGQFANGVWPIDKLGPPPGDPGCVVPRELVRELKLEDRYTPAGISRIGGRH